MTTTATVDRAAEIVNHAEEIYLDVDFAPACAWKAAEEGRKVVAYLPVVAPLELITAAGMYPLGIVGAGEQLEIIRGDAYFQSYICHLPRSIVELGVSGRLDVCDGFLFPSTCDVIRNLSGMWQMMFPDRYVKYIDVPHDRRPELGVKWYRIELNDVKEGLERLAGRPITDEAVWRAIGLHDENRRLLRELYDLRSSAPWQAPASEVYLVQRAGLALHVEEHNRLLADYLAAARANERPTQDLCRVVLTGAFCEQPPIGLLRTLERAGCAIVDDDLLLGPRLLRESVVREGETPTGNPVDALVEAFVRSSTPTATLYQEDEEKGAALAATVKARKADGVIFCAPSFCDPALLDRPMLAAALDRRGINHTSFKYSENTGQFQTIREQAGTFSDALRLWS